MAVKLVVDSSSDITETEANKLGITMLPMTITFGQEEFFDGVNITANQFYKKLVESSELPKTSQINAFRFEEAFDKYVKNVDEVVAIVISSKLSGTYNSALQAAEKYKDRIYVVDSLNATAGIRILIDYALRLIDEGKSAKEIFEILEDKKNKVQVRAMIDTLKFLKKGGRISAVAAIAGGMLGLKPLLAVIDGKVEVIGKCIGMKKAITFINKDIEKLGGIDFDMPFYVLYSGENSEKADKYIQDNIELWDCKIEDIRTNCLGATIGTHIGPGAIGLAFFSK